MPRCHALSDFVAVVDQVMALLRQRGRVTYRTLKRQFQLDEAALEDLKVELIEGQRLASDEQGTVLVWTGEDVVASPPAVPPPPAHAPWAYTPAYLAEQIVTSCSASQASASRSPSSLPTSRAPWSSSRTVTRKRPGNSSMRSWSA
jgi:hypothetical protein